MSDLTTLRRLGADVVATEFQKLDDRQRALLAHICPDLYRASAWFVEHLSAEMDEPATVLTTAEAAAYLGISPRAVRFAFERGRLTISKSDKGGRVFDRAEVERYAATRRQRAVADCQSSPVFSASP